MRTLRLGGSVLALASVLGVSCSGRADEGFDTDRLGIRARVAIPVAVLSYGCARDRVAAGLSFGLSVRGLSRFAPRERGIVLEDALETSVAASPLRGVSTGAAFGWRYGAELGVRGAQAGMLVGASIDTTAWAFSTGPSFT